MRFVWPAQRYDGLTREAWGLAATLTVAASVAIALPLARHHPSDDRPTLLTTQPRESIEFVQPTALLATESSGAEINRHSLSHRPTHENKLPNGDTSSVGPVRIRPTPVDTVAAPASGAVAPTSGAIGPVAAPSAFSKVMNLSDAARDSLNKAQAQWLRKRLLNFELTPEQKDSAGREQGQRAVAARDDHRPLAIPLGSVPLRMPFGGGVKSREQQRKDSVVRADNLQRLARLAERARAKRDSTMRATLAAKRDTDDRRDSLTRLGRPRP